MLSLAVMLIIVAESMPHSPSGQSKLGQCFFLYTIKNCTARRFHVVRNLGSVVRHSSNSGNYLHSTYRYQLSLACADTGTVLETFLHLYFEHCSFRACIDFSNRHKTVKESANGDAEVMLKTNDCVRMCLISIDKNPIKHERATALKFFTTILNALLISYTQYVLTWSVRKKTTFCKWHLPK